MAKRGPKPKEVDIDKVEELSEEGLTKEQIATCLGMSLSTFMERQAENVEISEAYKRGEIARSRFVVSALKNKIKDGDTTAIIFGCKAWAGMKDRIDHTSNGETMGTVLAFGER